ncbi:MAG TPA: hypothetical protein VNH11_10025 [Pirellulales bacterium]|nr:hypothetical protein [Pirellulales bacterium]
MKVGILVECGPDGMEHHMCRRVGELLAHETGLDLEVDVVPMDNKERLLEECGTAARDLLENGCDRVVILWDERPALPVAQVRSFLPFRRKAGWPVIRRATR